MIAAIYARESTDQAGLAKLLVISSWAAVP
jgi:hypothetical protein